MKKYKFVAVTVLICLAAASFFLPYKSYYASFIFTSDHKTYERVIDNLFGWSIVSEFCFLVVFTPAAAIAIFQTRLQRNLAALLPASSSFSIIVLLVGYALWFGTFETQVKLLFGYFIFTGLSVFGCAIFWIMTTCEIWHRIHNRLQRLKTA